ncbi:MAG: AraC family transcriptional regulator [Betaproteobacteria bacterium HGW-Betaproteobacteria-13]|jgi:AraC-like DNA-binding protein|uniref:AraC family transcriptional regulator n=1 Tax=Parazoarcus communis TaxID=41977 RepID=A0A2U8H6X5_9RHOO|nr:AraC family transcriptional regulator [Parazoarcus communis]AWI81428.1 AraC family transcriptional regulator [Parazoarcus communis]PKO82630.1 MAG: AraC family transcriptional regulator [Betaproteobacteria bacterium HGW-Betaproteobacteria-13]
MTNRLDRLSALLDGLAPRVGVMRPRSGISTLSFDATQGARLHLHLIARGEIELRALNHETTSASAPAIAICRADIAHSITVSAPDALMCAEAILEGPAASLLLNEFSRPLVLALDESDASLGHVVRLIASELSNPRCGQPALLDRAGDILFIGLLRHLVAQPQTSSGLFNGLADTRIARALVAIHAAPQTQWSLEMLADEAGMSRTAFTTRFRELMLQPPGKYLAQIRLSIANQAVRAGAGLKQAARDSGYASTAALSRALSRSHARSEAR